MKLWEIHEMFQKIFSMIFANINDTLFEKFGICPSTVGPKIIPEIISDTTKGCPSLINTLWTILGRPIINTNCNNNCAVNAEHKSNDPLIYE